MSALTTSQKPKDSSSTDYILQTCTGLVQLVSASLPSHQVLGSKPSLCRIFCGGKTLLRLFPSPDSTCVGASGTRSALFMHAYDVPNTGYYIAAFHKAGIFSFL
jgi:hypothetical protein